MADQGGEAAGAGVVQVVPEGTYEGGGADAGEGAAEGGDGRLAQRRQMPGQALGGAFVADAQRDLVCCEPSVQGRDLLSQDECLSGGVLGKVQTVVGNGQGPIKPEVRLNDADVVKALMRFRRCRDEGGDGRGKAAQHRALGPVQVRRADEKDLLGAGERRGGPAGVVAVRQVQFHQCVLVEMFQPRQRRPAPIVAEAGERRTTVGGVRQRQALGHQFRARRRDLFRQPRPGERAVGNGQFWREDFLVGLVQSPESPQPGEVGLAGRGKPGKRRVQSFRQVGGGKGVRQRQLPLVLGGPPFQNMPQATGCLTPRQDDQDAAQVPDTATHIPCREKVRRRVQCGPMPADEETLDHTFLKGLPIRGRGA